MNEPSRLDRLREAGVVNEQLEKADLEHPESQPHIKYNSKNTTVIGEILIPVHKIKSLALRSDVTLSWLNNFLDNEHFRQIGTNRGFGSLLNSLEQKGLQSFVDSFQVPQKDKITAIYYRDLDQYTVEEGKHRATLAKIIGMKTIMADVIQVDAPDEVRRFLTYREKRQTIWKMIEDLGLRYQIQESQGLAKEEKILITYNETAVGSLMQYVNYWDDEGEIDWHLRAMNQLRNNIKTLRIMSFLPFLQTIHALFLWNKNESLTNHLVERLIKSGYFK